ncbi:hypothetical protein [Acinetobacter indicus]|uniref:hypothetical protein n=1 Tax=Acinetobacter indicus TaxID=756892 RepID=UPI001362D4BB|nr:hypothetical protein [Acinetobacter indicus]
MKNKSASVKEMAQFAGRLNRQLASFNKSATLQRLIWQGLERCLKFNEDKAP